jgi:hypothetical protein
LPSTNSLIKFQDPVNYCRYSSAKKEDAKRKETREEAKTIEPIDANINKSYLNRIGKVSRHLAITERAKNLFQAE